MARAALTQRGVEQLEVILINFRQIIPIIVVSGILIQLVRITLVCIDFGFSDGCTMVMPGIFSSAME